MLFCCFTLGGRSLIRSRWIRKHNIPAYVLTNKEIIEKSNLKETSLHQLALKCNIEDTTKFVNRFIDYDRRVR